MSADDRTAAILEGVEGLLDVLDLISLVAGCAKAELAAQPAQVYLESLTPLQVQRLARVLVIEAVWRLPLPVEVPRTAGEIEARQRELQSWSWRRRQDAIAARRRIRARMARRSAPTVPGTGPRPPGGAA